MSNEKQTLLDSLLDAESRFYEIMSVKDAYSKLFFRSILWFMLFSVVYTIVTGL